MESWSNQKSVKQIKYILCLRFFKVATLCLIHNFHRGFLLSLFGRCSSVVVAGLLATTDPFFFFVWFCLFLTRMFYWVNFCGFINLDACWYFVRDYFCVWLVRVLGCATGYSHGRLSHCDLFRSRMFFLLLSLRIPVLLGAFVGFVSRPVLLCFGTSQISIFYLDLSALLLLTLAPTSS